MRLHSLGLSSDVSLLDADVLDRGEYLVVRSPKEPGFYWGNLLIFSEPPTAAKKEQWETIFAKEFADLPKMRHRTFAWDIGGAKADLSRFIDDGYHQEKTVVLTASQVSPPRYPIEELEIRVLQSESEWNDLAEIQWLPRDPELEADGYRAFLKGRLASLRSRVKAGQGEWCGARNTRV